MVVLEILLIAAILAVGVVLLLAAGKPDEFRLERKAVIHAKPGKILSLIEDFHAWSIWSPWEDVDPAMKRTYSGSATGVGARYAWEGNRKVGSGKMEITEVQAASRVKVKLDFLKPFEAHNTAEFSLVQNGETTEATWAMYGPNRFFAKVMHVVFDMDKMVGKDFEKGLARLKTAAEL